MANTRNRNVNADNANNGEASNAESLTPLPLPTLEHVLMMQAQMLQTMQQTMINMQAQPPGQQPP
jgi:hypothetical protein